MNQEQYEMVPIEVGSFIWYAGYGILLGLIVALFFLAPRVGDEKMAKWEKFLGWFTLANLLWYQGMALLAGVWMKEESLPLHMCSFSQVLLFIHLIYKKDWAFQLLAFWGPLGGIQAFLTPALETDPTFGFVLQFYLAHGLVVLAPIYLMVHGGRRLEKGGVWRVIGITFLTGYVMMPLNALLGSNYMYTNNPPPVDHPLVQGEWPGYLVWIQMAVIVLFLMFYYGFRRYWSDRL